MFGKRRISINSLVRDEQGRIGRVDTIWRYSPIDGKPAAYIIGSNPLGGTFAAWVSLKSLTPVKASAVYAEAHTA